MQKLSMLFLSSLLIFCIGFSFRTRASEGESCRATILVGNDFAALDEYITPDTLVVLDLDNTIFRSSTSMGSAEWFYHIFSMAVTDGLDKPSAAALSYLQFSPSQQFVSVEQCEAGLSKRIKGWQEKSRAVIGLTARQLKVLPRTFDQLHSIDVGFTANPWMAKSIEFEAPYPTSFYEGIIFAHYCNEKGEIFTQFLDQIADSQIRRIVFVDDRERNIPSMRDACLSHNLEFVALRYSGQDAKYAHFDPAVAALQQYFMGNVIPDELARKILMMPEGQELLPYYRDPIEDCERVDHTLVAAKEESSRHLPLCDYPLYDVPIEMLETTHIADLLDLADENTLVVLDLNDVLMRPGACLGSDVWAHHICSQAMEKEGISKEEALDRLVPFWEEVLLRSSVQPVEVSTARVLHALQQRGCKMIGLTARYIELAYPTLNSLRSLWIDFSKNSVAKSNFTLFTPYPCKYINGVVFAGLQNDKAGALIQFFEQNSIECNKIVFVDDKKKNVEGVARAARALNKPYIGVWYRAVEAAETPLDENVFKLQQVLLNSIIPDSIAKELVSQGAWKKASVPTY